MEIYNEQMELMGNPDLTKGWLKDSIRTVHHEAVEGVQEQGHYEVIAEYSNGGKDVAWIVDVEGVQAQDAWDEEIPIHVYYPYTQEELDSMEEAKNRPTMAERISALENQLAAYEAAYAEGVQEA